MAVKVNISTGESAPKRLFQGIMSVNVVAVNPNLRELAAMGFNTTDREGKDKPEPVYMGEKYGVRLEFWLSGKVGNDDILNKVTYFVKDKLRTDIFINKQGNFGKDDSRLGNDIRNPYDGEVELLMFIQRLCNVRKGEELYLETIGKIAKKGDVRELKEIVQAAKENVIKVLLGIRSESGDDGKEKYYQEVYNRKVEAAYGNDYSYMHKDVVANYDYLKADYGIGKIYNPHEFVLREYFPGAQAQPDATSSFQKAATPAPAAQAAQPVGAPAAPSWMNDPDSELPF